MTGYGSRVLSKTFEETVTISKPFNAVEVLTRVYNLLELRLLHLESNRKGRNPLIKRRSTGGELHEKRP